MSDVSQDLRDAACFARWADALPADLSGVMRQAAMSYIEFDDTISIVVPHTLHAQLQQRDICKRLMLEVASYYDRNRGRWLADTGGPMRSKVPSSVVMPRMRFEFSPPQHSLH